MSPLVPSWKGMPTLEELEKAGIDRKQFGQWAMDAHRRVYDRADRIADRISWFLIVAFAAFVVAQFVRAWLHYDAWKWMVQP